MSQQYLVIGLGQFGLALAAALESKGAEVLAVDIDKKAVEAASSLVTEALVLDATDESALARLNPAGMDAAICAVGGESRDASIVCTALLRQMGVKCVIARANNPMHQRILKMVGAHKIINPEQEFGAKFANRLLFSELRDEMSIGSGLTLSEIAVKGSLVGKTLIELALPKRFGIMVVAVRHAGIEAVTQPDPNEPLKEGDSMLIVSKESSLKQFMEGI